MCCFGNVAYVSFQAIYSNCVVQTDYPACDFNTTFSEEHFWLYKVFYLVCGFGDSVL